MNNWNDEIDKILARFFDAARNDEPWTPEKQSKAHQRAKSELRKVTSELVKELEAKHERQIKEIRANERR